MPSREGKTKIIMKPGCTMSSGFDALIEAGLSSEPYHVNIETWLNTNTGKVMKRNPATGEWVEAAECEERDNG